MIKYKHAYKTWNTTQQKESLLYVHDYSSCCCYVHYDPIFLDLNIKISWNEYCFPINSALYQLILIYIQDIIHVTAAVTHKTIITVGQI